MPRPIHATAMLFAVAALAMGPAHGQAGDTPPNEGNALLKWLQAGSYLKWPKESAPHRSMGPHKSLVLTYLNPVLDRSLDTKAKAHPQGAAAVKELLDEAGKLSGWAVSVKTATDSDGGKGWYWYEILGSTSNGSVVAQANGVPLCAGCHARGSDFVLISHPLD